MSVTYRVDYDWGGERQQRAIWVATLMPAAEPTAAKIGISPEAIIAQAALESGWGKEAIGYNIFGVKADASWAGKRRLASTHEEVNGSKVALDDWFRDYDSYEESIADHFRFLDDNPRYRTAGVFDRKGDEAYFKALDAAGYASDSNYAALLSGVLRSVQALTAKMTRLDTELANIGAAIGMCIARPTSHSMWAVQPFLSNRTFVRQYGVEYVLDMRVGGSTPPYVERKVLRSSGWW